jgi:hypothetical protein
MLLVDLALAVMILAAALFLGAVAVALYKEASKNKIEKKDD